MRIARVVIVLSALFFLIAGYVLMANYYFASPNSVWMTGIGDSVFLMTGLVFTIAAVFLLAYSCMLKTRNAKHLAAGAMFLALSQMLGLPFFYLMITDGPIYEMWAVPAIMLGLGFIYLLRFFKEEMK
jgi:uncharacterized membrane protein YesL